LNYINITKYENKEKFKKEKNYFDYKFSYDKYQNNFITEKIIQYSGCILSLNDAKFINGLIRKRKPKNCLEIGVASGGSAILILNAIKDINNSCLVSLDLKKFFHHKKIGYRVNEYYPELAKNWKLFTGDQPHKFLVKLNMKFDFLFLDSAHIAPGELLNFIEALPFLNENAIVVIHDILWHFSRKKRIYPSNINLFPAIYGDKILLGKNDNYIGNTGAVFLYENQKSHYLDYFLLLLNFWEYIPKDNQINDLRIFIKEYYKNDFYLKLFNIAVKNNIFRIKKHTQNYNLIKNKADTKRSKHIIR
jgi:predicted O-methyltransferase YrrM